MPTLGATLLPFLPSDKSEVLGRCLPGQGAEDRVPTLLSPSAGQGCWESGRRATERCAGRDGDAT